MRRRLCLLLLIALMIVTAGCNGAHETDQIVYVVAIGIDKGENDKLIITYQLAIPRQISGSSSGSDSASGASGEATKKFANITIVAFSLAEARNQLKSIAALTPAIDHTKMIIFGESLAQSGIDEVIGPLFRFPKYRGSMYVAVAKNSAQNFLEKNTPAITGSTAKYYELMMQGDRGSGFYLSTTLHKFYIGMKGHGSDAYAVYVGANPKVKADKVSSDTKEKPEGYKEMPQVAGEISRIGGDAAEFAGTAVFSGDKMVGLLDSSQTRMVSLYLTRLQSSYITIDDLDPAAAKQGITLRFRASGPPEVKTQIVDGKAIAHIQLTLEGEISSIASGINYEEPQYREALENKLSQIFTQDFRGLIFYLQECNSDVLGIGDYFRPRFATLPDFINFNWKETFKEAQIDGNVQFKIRRNGLMWKTNPIVE